MTNPSDPAFAGLAMQGLSGNRMRWGMPNDDIARYSVDQADALITELNKDQKAGE